MLSVSLIRKQAVQQMHEEIERLRHADVEVAL